MKHLKSFKIFESNYKDVLECMQVLIDEYDFTHSSNSIYSDKLYKIDTTNLKNELISTIKKLKDIGVEFTLELESLDGTIISSHSKYGYIIIDKVNEFFNEYETVAYVAFHITSNIKSFESYNTKMLDVMSDEECCEIFTAMVDSGFRVRRERVYTFNNGEVTYTHADVLPSGIVVDDELPTYDGVKSFYDEFMISGSEPTIVSSELTIYDVEEEEVSELEKLTRNVIKKLESLESVSLVKLNKHYHHGMRYIKVRYTCFSSYM